MTFLAPANLLLLGILPLIGIFLIWREHIRKNRLMRLGNTVMVFVDSHPFNRHIKMGLWLLAMGMIIIALARPTWGITSEAIEADGVAIIFVVDISNSMDARDISPSRLDRAKLILADIIQNLPNSFIGMVVFAGEAYVQMPLTRDSRSALTFLNAISTQSISQQGTALASALDVALALRDERITQKTVMIVISDGENHEGNPLIPAEKAKQDGIIIHTIGIGTPDGAEIPLIDENGAIIGSKTDAFGAVVITRLDETPLRQIADSTGGIYRLASTTGSEIRDILGQIGALRDEQVQVQIQNRQAERFNIFVILAFMILVGEGFISSKRRSNP
ncbi:MAG: VWA domain-containing protein [bacterium]|nr:VWA domain-containing protein [bacterium]